MGISPVGWIFMRSWRGCQIDEGISGVNNLLDAVNFEIP